MDLFCRIISLENAAEFLIFCRTLSEALVRQSKIYKCQLALTGAKGLNGDIVFDDVVIKQLKVNTIIRVPKQKTFVPHF